MAAHLKGVQKALGKDVYLKLKTEVDEGRIPVAKAVTFFFLLNSEVGGHFNNKREQQNFTYDGAEFMLILEKYYSKLKKAERKNMRDSILKTLRDQILGLEAVAYDLEDVTCQNDSAYVAEEKKKEKDEIRKRWEKACKEGNKEEVEKLLREERKLPSSQKFLDSVVTEEGNANLTPLAVASLNGRTDIVKLLIDSGASMSRVSSWTPLEMAVTGRHFDTAEELKARGSDPNYDLPREEEHYRRNAEYRKRKHQLINYNDEFEEKLMKLKGLSSRENDG